MVNLSRMNMETTKRSGSLLHIRDGIDNSELSRILMGSLTGHVRAPPNKFQSLELRRAGKHLGLERSQGVSSGRNHHRFTSEEELEKPVGKKSPHSMQRQSPGTDVFRKKTSHHKEGIGY
jgi:hypothetical protein